MPRNEVIEFKVTAEEKESIRSQAAHLKVPVSEFVRSCALREHLGSPVPYETEHDQANKAKVRQAVENEESYEVEAQAGTAVPFYLEKDETDEASWLTRRQRELRMRMSARSAAVVAIREWKEQRDD